MRPVTLRAKELPLLDRPTPTPWRKAVKRRAEPRDVEWFASLTPVQQRAVRFDLAARSAEVDVDNDGPRLSATMTTVTATIAVFAIAVNLLGGDTIDGVVRAIQPWLIVMLVCLLVLASSVGIFGLVETQRRAVYRTWELVIELAGEQTAPGVTAAVSAVVPTPYAPAPVSGASPAPTSAAP